MNGTDGEPLSLYEEAIETWGEDAQIDMLGEECSELSAEVFRYWRGRSDESDLAEEAADVEIMLRQLRLIIGNGKIERAKAEKLSRLQDRLAEAPE